MSLEVLISTMHQKKNDFSLIEKMNIQTDAVVINQCDYSGREEFEYRGNRILWISTKERGLSKSRNLAIENATADICLIADDDEVFLDGYADIIKKTFDKYPEVDLIRFKIRGIERPFKTYQNEGYDINIRLSLKISSVEVAFRRRTIVQAKLKFDELIGAGTEFLMGEENAFVFSFLKKGKKARYQPEYIADLHIGDSTWFSGYNEKYFFARGAAYAAMGRFTSLCFIILFAFTHKKLYRKQLSTTKTISLMLKGRKKYYERMKENG